MAQFIKERDVRCPACHKFRKTRSMGSVQCFFCGKNFTVIRKDHKHKLQDKKPVELVAEFVTYPNTDVVG